jgi:hypothetical protein
MRGRDNSTLPVDLPTARTLRTHVRRRAVLLQWGARALDVGDRWLTWPLRFFGRRQRRTNGPPTAI